MVSRVVRWRAGHLLYPFFFTMLAIAVVFWVSPAGAQSGQSPNDELFDAAMIGDLGAVQGLLRQGADINYVKPGSDKTVLQAAISEVSGMYTGAHMQVVKLLIERGAKLEENDNAPGTALFTAVRVNGITPQTDEQIQVVKMLLDHGANTGLIAIVQATALHGAVDCMHLESARLLIEHGANVNATDGYGATALQIVKSNDWAKEKDKQLMIDLLRKAGAK
jgi:ankyrin repeat protein